MRFLLDTHVLVWWLVNGRPLSTNARTLLTKHGADIVVSAVSAFEIATKVRLRKFEEARPINDDFVALVEAEGFAFLSIGVAHSLKAGQFRQAHGDPFDRLLAAQALTENLILVTRDSAFADFGVETLW